MRTRFQRSGILLPLALGLALSACNRTEDSAPTVAGEPPEIADAAPVNAAFAREASAIKSRETDPAKREAAMRDLMSRFGYPALPARASGPGAAPVPGSAPGALEKTAATEWTQVRGMNLFYPFAHSKVVSVPANGVLEAIANQGDAGSDPMLLAFYKTTSSGNAAAYWVKFVGYNDDRAAGNLNAYFKWTNTTGAAKTIRVVSWSYPGTYGVTNLTVRVTANGVASRFNSTLWVSGATEFETTSLHPDYAACTGPSASEIKLKRSPTSVTGYGHSLVAFNAGTMRGAFIRDTDYSLRLDEVLPPGGPSFLLGYFEGDGYQPDPMGIDDATLDALDAHYHFPLYFGSQNDRYACP